MTELTHSTLDQLKPGSRATVDHVGGESALMQRLLEFGLMEGEVVEVVALAPLGDPIEICCGNSRLSLRRREAAVIRITPLSPQ